jgi:hypothetical protein
VKKQRFEDLAGAYGGDIARWPAAVRDEAALLATAEPEFARAVLTAEGALDAALDEAPRAPASSALFEQIVAAAPPLRRRKSWRMWIAPAGLSAGLAAATAAGLLAGAQLSWTSRAGVETSSQAVADLDVSSISEIG